MAELLVKEAPGGDMMTFVCPTCSRMYPEQDGDGATLEVPRTCRRCGSPMDLTKGLEYAAKLAEQAKAQPAQATRRTVTR